MTATQRPNTRKPGPWPWREHLPTCLEDWAELRSRAIEARPDGVDVLRFSDWALAEMRGEAGGITSPNTLSKYRRLLVELASGPPPTKNSARRRRGDSGMATTRALGRLGAAASGIVALATGNPALALTAPVILADESYVESLPVAA